MRLFLLSLLLTFACLEAAFSDTIELENGDRITGKITQMTEDTVTVKTDYGIFAIKRKFIAKGLFDIQGTIPRLGLALELLFSGNLIDTSSNGYKVMNNGLTFTQGRDGSSASAIASDGSGQIANIIKAPALDGLQAFSIAVWFNTKNVTKSQYIVSKWSSTSGSEAEGKFAVLYKSGMVTCYVVDQAGTYYTIKCEETAEPAKWNHLVFTCGKTALVLYLNGKKAGEIKYEGSGLKNDDSPLFIMSAKAANDPKMAFYNFEGSLDNLRIYTRELSEKEAFSLYKEFGAE
jgi:hypothetical protein